ncbi:MAG: P-type conjugative transfer protein TrbL [Alphaproteobacteria bacterium]
MLLTLEQILKWHSFVWPGTRPVKLFAVLVLALVFILGASDAIAQTAQTVQPGADNSLDPIVKIFRDSTRQWEQTLGGFALQLFWLLVGIEFTFAALMLGLRGADFSEWLSTLVQQILFIGFFLALITHSAEWAHIIIDSFRQAAAAAAQKNGVTIGLAPSNVLDTGLQIALKFVASVSLWSPAASIGLFFAALLIIVCFALISAFMVMALVESYIVISAGVLFMGFGGSRWTKDLALKIIMYTVSVGAKLFVLHLLVALGMQVFASLGANVSTSNASVLGVIAVALVMLVLTWSVPDMVQGLINGTSFGNSGAMLTGTAYTSGQIAVGGGMATHAAATLASAQLASADAAGSAPKTTAGRGLWMAGATAWNFGSAVVRNEVARLSGRPPYGTRLAQAAADMHGQARAKSGQGGTASDTSEGGAAPSAPVPQNSGKQHLTPRQQRPKGTS